VAAAKEKYLGMLYHKYRRDHDLALPEGWNKAPSSGSGGGKGISRDNREYPAAKTCDLASAMFSDLDVIVCDTSKYDQADSFILSAFFVPFYYLNYSPSSATGNGDVYEEALASAYMELVERVPVCGKHIGSMALSDLPEDPFPEEDIPQFYNWGVDRETRRNAVDCEGYVAVTDILSDKVVFIPRFSVMFGYSGTDGNASGNTLPEAILYGIYELIERDTCQIHLVDATCRERLSEFQVGRTSLLDDRCQTLLDQFDEKGCSIAVFDMPNIYGLPCVMCHVYDRNREIQCHGSVAVRPDFNAAAYSALHEAYMQYITYFVGTRDDYHSHAPAKKAKLAFIDAQKMFFEEEPSLKEAEKPVVFGSIQEELDSVIGQLTRVDVRQILVADMSPLDRYVVKSAKVIIPGQELWFCPSYRPSRFFADRAKRTVDVIEARYGK